MKLNISDFEDIMLEAFKNDLEFVLPLHGTSMNPFFHTGDQVVLKKSEAYKKLDCVLYKRENGQYVFHRILKIKKGIYYIAGDNQTTLEEVNDNQILAKMIGYIIDGKHNKKDNKKFKLFSFLWKSFLLRKIYHLLKRTRQN